ncbi:hypothetical protein SAMN05443637_11962 [Pseudonocardia thermophila]|jgi:hypothetical protein|uniref:Uncharacterized protein n=1 Tax=Pseudonocardia thermophila TaxID=1848 RepID=A0A1M6Y8Z1_PSETH|nr:hypothetical protein [Pseudonocardia thermophila]SHL14766.1 hypothetical protein SAMN05443637_11962 [Pseudonocardia thermophila]
MLILVALIGAAIVALVLWRAMHSARAGIAEPPPRRQATGPVRRIAGPDDDPEFLRRLAEQVRRQQNDPPKD